MHSCKDLGMFVESHYVALADLELSVDQAGLEIAEICLPLPLIKDILHGAHLICFETGSTWSRLAKHFGSPLSLLSSAGNTGMHCHYLFIRC